MLIEKLNSAKSMQDKLNILHVFESELLDLSEQDLRQTLEYLQAEIDSTTSSDWYASCKALTAKIKTFLEAPSDSYDEFIVDNSDSQFEAEESAKFNDQSFPPDALIRDIRTYFELSPSDRISAISDLTSESMPYIKEFYLQAMVKESSPQVLEKQILDLPTFFEPHHHQISAVISLLERQLSHANSSVAIASVKLLLFYSDFDSSAQKASDILIKACDHKSDTVAIFCQKILLKQKVELATRWLERKFIACNREDDLNDLEVYSDWPSYDVYIETARNRILHSEMESIDSGDELPQQLNKDQVTIFSSGSSSDDALDNIIEFIKSKTDLILWTSLICNIFLFTGMTGIFLFGDQNGSKSSKNALEIEDFSSDDNNVVEIKKRDLLIADLRSKIAELEQSDRYAYEKLLNLHGQIRNTSRLDQINDFLNQGYDFHLKYPDSKLRSELHKILVPMIKQYSSDLFKNMDENDHGLASDALMNQMKLVKIFAELLAKTDSSFLTVASSADQRIQYLGSYHQKLKDFYLSLEKRSFEKALVHLEAIKALSNQREHTDLYQKLASARYAEKLDDFMSIIKRSKELSEKNGYEGSPYLISWMYKINNEIGFKSKANRFLKQLRDFKSPKELFDDPQRLLRDLNYLGQTVSTKFLESYLLNCTQTALEIDVDTYGSQAEALATIARAQINLRDFDSAELALNRIILKTDFYDTNSSIIKGHAQLDLWRAKPNLADEGITNRMSRMKPEVFGTNLLRAYAAREKYDEVMKLLPNVTDLKLSDLVETLAKKKKYTLVREIIESKTLKLTEDSKSEALKTLGLQMLLNDDLSGIDEILNRLNTISGSSKALNGIHAIELAIARVKYFVEKNSSSEAQNSLDTVRTKLEGEFNTTADLVSQILGMIELAKGYALIKDKSEELKVYEAALQLIKKIPDTEENLLEFKRPLFNRLITALSETGYSSQLKKTGLELYDYAEGFGEAFIANRIHRKELAISYAKAGLIDSLKKTLLALEKDYDGSNPEIIELSEIYLECALNYIKH